MVLLHFVQTWAIKHTHTLKHTGQSSYQLDYGPSHKEKMFLSGEISASGKTHTQRKQRITKGDKITDQKTIFSTSLVYK